MKKKFTKFLYTFATAIATGALLLSLVPSSVFAATNTLHISVSPASPYNINASFTATVWTNVEAPTNPGTVSGTLLFPANLLQVTSTSITGSAYGNPAIAPGGGAVDFSGSVNPGPQGFKKVFSVSFQTKAGGSGALSFTSGSTINSSATVRNTLGITVNSPTPSAPPASAPPAPVVSTPPPAPVATPPPASEVKDNTNEDASGVITDVAASPGYDKATVTWKHAREQASTTLIYGGTRTSMTTKAQVTRQPDGTYSAALIGLKPGLRYYYSIASEDSAKKVSKWDSLVVTKGYPITIDVTENDVAAASAIVRIGSLSRTADQKGATQFELAAGNYNATITLEDKTTKNVTFSVAAKAIPADGKAPESQRYTFNLIPDEGAGGASASLLTFIAVLLVSGVVIALGVIGYLAWRRKQYEGSYDNEYVATGPSVTVDDGYTWKEQTPSTPLPPATSDPSTEHIARQPGAASDDYEEPKDMFEIAKEREDPRNGPS